MNPFNVAVHWGDITVYLVMLGIIAVAGILTKRLPQKTGDKVFILIAFSLIIAVASIRKYTVGIDLYYQYAKMYLRIGDMDWADMFSLRYEPGYIIFCKLLSYINPDYQFYIIVTSFLCYGSVGLFIYRNSENVRLSTFTFICCNMMFMYMNVIRQALAVALVLLATESLKKKYYLRYTLMVFLAATIHTSAIVALFLLLFSFAHYKRKYVFAALGVYAVAILFGRQFFEIATSMLGKYEEYVDSERYGVAVINLYTVSNTLIVLALFILANRFIFRKIPQPRKVPEHQFRPVKIDMGVGLFTVRRNVTTLGFNSEFMMYMALMLIITQSAVVSMQILSRLRSFFHPFLWLLLPMIVNRITEIKWLKYVVYALLIFYFLYTAFHSSAGNFGTIPYKFFWEEYYIR